MANQLKVLADEIAEKKHVAEQDPGFDPLSRRVRLGKIQKAKEEVKELIEQYREEIRLNAAFILVTGSNAEKFNSVAVKDFNCFSVDANDFYDKICENIDKKLYTGYTSSPNHFNLVGARLEEVANEIGVKGYPPLLFEARYKKVINGKEELVKLVKRAFNDKVGAEMISMYAINEIVNQAAKVKFGSKIVPIILLCKDESLISDFKRDFPLLISKGTFVVGAGDVNEETSKLALTTVKSGTKKQVEESLSLIRQKLK